MLKIDKAVAIPAHDIRTKYPWRDMAINDSFLAPDTTATKMGACVAYGRKITGFTFTIRTVKGGVRVWRIK